MQSHFCYLDRKTRTLVCEIEGVAAPFSPSLFDDLSPTQITALLCAHSPSQATPLALARRGAAGVAGAASVLAAKYGIEAGVPWRLRPVAAQARRFFEGGVQPVMLKGGAVNLETK